MWSEGSIVKLISLKSYLVKMDKINRVVSKKRNVYKKDSTVLKMRERR